MKNYEPQVWNVVFNREAATGWARLVPGRFKHVRAYAFVPATNLWLFYDVHFGGTKLFAVPAGPDALAAIFSFIGPPGASEIVSVRVLPRRRRILPLTNWCTTALRHLLNLPRGALRPSAFYRDCLKNGVPFEARDGRADLPSPTP